MSKEWEEARGGRKEGAAEVILGPPMLEVATIARLHEVKLRVCGVRHFTAASRDAPHQGCKCEAAALERSGTRRLCSLVLADVSISRLALSLMLSSLVLP